MKSIFAILLLVAAGAIFFMYTQPTYDQTQQVQAQVDSYNAALDKATQLQTLKQSLLSKYNSFDPNAIARLQKLLPDHVDNIALILDIDSIAQKHGLALQNVDVSSVAAAGATAQTAAPVIGGSSQSYASLAMTFSTQGSYADFVSFLTDLETSLRIVDLTSLKISAPTPSGTAGAGAPNISSQSAYSYDVTLRTYWLK